MIIATFSGLSDRAWSSVSQSYPGACPIGLRSPSLSSLDRHRTGNVTSPSPFTGWRAHLVRTLRAGDRSQGLAPASKASALPLSHTSNPLLLFVSLLA